MKKLHALSPSARFLLIGLIIVFFAASLASMVQTSGGKITLKQLSLVSDQGNVITAVMYIPKGVNEENPAPGVLAIHGGNSSRYAVNNFAQEFARRGYVVISIDQSCNAQSDRGENNFFGEEAAMKYMTTLRFVDQTRLGVMGHSMGSTVVSMAAANPQFNIKAGISLGAGVRIAPDTPINVMVLIGTADENTGPRGKDTLVRGPKDAYKSSALAAVFGLPEGEIISLGKEYGSRSDNTLRIMRQPNSGHLGILYSSEAIAMALDFMGDVLNVQYSRPSGSQVWIWREFLTAIAYIGLFLTAFGVIGIKLNRRKDELVLENPAEGHGKPGAGYWIGLVFMCIIPAVAMQNLYMAGKSFFIAISRTVFAMEHISGIVFWMVTTALIILGVNLIIRKLMRGYDWSFDRDVLKIEPVKLLSYLAIAFSVMLILYLIVYLAGFFFDINIRFINTEVHLFTRTRFFVFFAYLPLFFMYFFIIGYVQTTGLLCKGQSVFSQYLRTVIVSLFAPGIMLIIYYGSNILIGINYLFIWRFVLGVLFNFLPGIAIGAIIQVYSYRKTGKIWLGTIINTVLFTWMSTSIGVMLPPA